MSPWLKIMVFGPILAPRPHMGNIVHKDPKPTLKMSERVLAFPFNSYFKIEAAMQICLWLVRIRSVHSQLLI